MENKRVLGVVLAVILMAVLFIEGSILRELINCGYGLAELPKTTMVFLHISSGFTTDKRPEDEQIEFIGRSRDFYDEYFEKKGYHKVYDLDGVDYYGKGEDSDFGIKAVGKNKWFAVYKISEDHPIEDFD